MSHHESAAKGAESRPVDRMLFFSDAVFAIMLTLLVLELRPPAAATDDRALLAGLQALQPQFVAFVLSFALGAAFWGVHMRITRQLRHFDWLTLTVNLVHLFTVALLPFAAALLGQHLNSYLAYLGYTSIIGAVSFSATLLFLVATRDKGRLMLTPYTGRQRLSGLLRTSAIGFAAAIGIAGSQLGFPLATGFCWLAVVPLTLIARAIDEPRKETT